MTTITMTFRQLRKLCNPKGEFICTKSAIHLCTDSGHCPICRRAKRREKRQIDLLRKSDEQWHKRMNGVFHLPPDLDPGAETERNVKESVGREFYKGVEHLACWLLDHCEGETITEEQLRPWAQKALAERKAKEPVGRSGTPLVRGGKIVRLPKKARRG